MKKSTALIVLAAAALALILLPIYSQKIQKVDKVYSASLERKLSNLERKVNSLEQQLNEYRRVIKFVGPNVEIQASGTLHLKGAIIKFNRGNQPILTKNSVIIVPTSIGAQRAVVQLGSPTIFGD